MFRYQQIKPSKLSTQPRQILFVAAEYFHGKQINPLGRTRSIHCQNISYIYTEWRTGKKNETYVECNDVTIDDVWAVIDHRAKKGNPLWIIGMDFRKFFDSSGLWNMLDEGKLSMTGPKQTNKIGCMILSNPPTIIDLYVSGTEARIYGIDVANFGVKITSKDMSSRKQLLFVYEWADWFANFLQDNDAGAWKPTAASQSWQTFRRKCLQHKLFAHNNEHALSVERDSYFGGRCEARQLGLISKYPSFENDGQIDHCTNSDIYYFDMVGSYLGIVKDLPIPTKFVGKLTGDRSLQQMATSKNYGVIARVDIETNEPAYPYRWPAEKMTAEYYADVPSDYNRKGEKIFWLKPGQVIWPVGKFTTTLAGPELSYAVRNGHVKNVHVAYLYRCEPALRAWFEFMQQPYLDAKKRGVKSHIDTMKIMSLSLFGKMASYQTIWETIEHEEPPKFWLQWLKANPVGEGFVTRRSVAGVVQELLGREEGPHSIPAISSWITSAQRVNLWQIISVCGYSNTLYWDTDCVITNQTGALNLCATTALCGHNFGQWRCKGILEWINIPALKNYQSNLNTVKAGVLDSKITVIEQPPLAHCLSHGDAPREYSVERTKVNIRPYRHGIVNPDKSVSPWRL